MENLEFNMEQMKQLEAVLGIEIPPNCELRIEIIQRADPADELSEAELGEVAGGVDTTLKSTSDLKTLGTYQISITRFCW